MVSFVRNGRSRWPTSGDETSARTTRSIPADPALPAAERQRPVRGERPSAGRGRGGPRELEDQVVALLAAREVLPGVVDDVVGAERTDEIHLPGAANAGNTAPERLGDLHGERADASTGTDDQDLLARLHGARIAQSLERGAPGQRKGGSGLEREIRRLRHEVALVGTHVLGERAFTPAEDLVPGSEPCHVPTDRLDLPGHVRSPDRVLRGAQPGPRHADDERAGPHEVPVLRVDRGGADAHQDLAVTDGRTLDLPELQHVRRAVPVLDDRPHLRG